MYIIYRCLARGFLLHFAYFLDFCVYFTLCKPMFTKKRRVLVIFMLQTYCNEVIYATHNNLQAEALPARHLHKSHYQHDRNGARHLHFTFCRPSRTERRNRCQFGLVVHGYRPSKVLQDFSRRSAESLFFIVLRQGFRRNARPGLEVPGPVEAQVLLHELLSRGASVQKKVSLRSRT